MTSEDPSGAVDNDFDDAATDAEAQLRKNIADFPAGIKPGDIVIDLVEGRPLYVRERKGTAIDVFEREAFDLTTYKAHPWLPVTPHDDVFECVFLPTKPSDIPSKKKSQTYSYPRGRLARVPVEWLYDSDTHRHFEATVERLSLLFENAADDDYRQAVVDVAAGAFGNEAVDLALEVAGFDPSKWGHDGDYEGPTVPVDGHDPKGSTGEADVLVDLIDALQARGASDAAIDAVADAVVHEFDPEVGDEFTPHLPKKDSGDGDTEDAGLGDFDDFDGDE